MKKIVDYAQKDLADNILRNAIQSRVSDIHFDPERNGLQVRFRIDGTLYKIENFTKEEQKIIV